MEAEHFDDIIRKKLANVEPPKYESSMWTKLQHRIIVPSQFDYKGVVAACSLLLNVLLATWIWQKDQTDNDSVQHTQAFKQVIMYDTVVYKTVVYDTTYRTTYVNNYQALESSQQFKEKINDIYTRNPGSAIDETTHSNEYQRVTTMTYSPTTHNSALQPGLTIAGNDSLMNEQPLTDSLQTTLAKVDSCATIADTEEKRHPRVYKQRREVFISPVVTIPIVNNGDAGKVKSNLLALELSYMPFNRVGVFGRISRYQTHYSVQDSQFRIEGGGVYGGNSYDYEYTSVSRVSFGYNLGLRGIVYRARHWQATADLGYGQFFHDRTSMTNRLQETSSGKIVFSELAPQNLRYSYITATLGVEHSIGYRTKVKFGLDIARNLESATTLEYIKAWGGLSAGLSYQLK